jgi:uncharacterized membrane protein (DUF485 family)
MRSFLALVGTFLVVYFATPWLVHFLIGWLPVAHPQRIENGIAILASIGVYSFLRKRFGDKIPPV